MQILSSNIYNDNCTVTLINCWSTKLANVEWYFIFSNWAKSADVLWRVPRSLHTYVNKFVHIYANYSFTVYYIMVIVFCSGIMQISMGDKVLECFDTLVLNQCLGRQDTNSSRFIFTFIVKTQTYYVSTVKVNFEFQFFLFPSLRSSFCPCLYLNVLTTIFFCSTSQTFI